MIEENYAVNLKISSTSCSQVVLYGSYDFRYFWTGDVGRPTVGDGGRPGGGGNGVSLGRLTSPLLPRLCPTLRHACAVNSGKHSLEIETK